MSLAELDCCWPPCVAAGAGECVCTATLMPLTADLAPEGLRGPLLSRSPAAVFAVAGPASAAAGVALLRLEPRLPAGARRTPRPGYTVTRHNRVVARRRQAGHGPGAAPGRV